MVLRRATQRVASVDLFSLSMEDTKDSLCLQAHPCPETEKRIRESGDKPLVSNFPNA